jgi:Gpi18-like mannosyltransferase
LKSQRGHAINFPFNKKEFAFLVGLLSVSFIVRLLLFPQQGYPVDTGDFQYWFNAAATHGLRTFYNPPMWCDYPPFNIYIFWFFGSLAKTFTSINVENWVKLAPNLFDLATATVIFLYLRKKVDLKLTVLGTALYAFNPAVIYNTAVWGQFDAIYTFLLVLSLVLALKGKPVFSVLSAAIFAISILTKPQAIALAPLIALLIYEKGGLKNESLMLIQNGIFIRLKSAWPKLKTLLISIFVFIVTVFIVILPFQWVNNNPVGFLSKIYFGAYSGYAYTSINAFNLWGLFGMWQSDANFFVLGWVMFAAVAVFVLYMVHKRFNVSTEAYAFLAAFILFFAFFMLPTRIHERYLFPAISVLALMFPLLKKTRPIYIALTATLFVNQAYVLYWLRASYPNAAPNLTGDPVVLAVGFANLITFFYSIILLWDELKTKRGMKLTGENNQNLRGEPKYNSI